MISQSLYLADRTRLWDRQIFRFLTMTFISSHFTFWAVSSSSFEATFRDIRSFLWLVTDSLTSCPKNREIRENNRRHFLHDIDRRTNARMQPEASQRDTIFPKTPSHRSTQPASARVSHPSEYLFLERHPSQSGMTQTPAPASEWTPVTLARVSLSCTEAYDRDSPWVSWFSVAEPWHDISGCLSLNWLDISGVCKYISF